MHRHRPFACSIGGLVTACFVAPPLLGEPCRRGEDCDPGQACDQEVCVPAQSTTSGAPLDPSGTDPVAESEEGPSRTPETPLDAWFCSGTADSESNLLRNASFEAWASPIQPLHWHGQNASLERDARDPFAGDSALRIGWLESATSQIVHGPFLARTVFEVRAAVRAVEGPPIEAIAIHVVADQGAWTTESEIPVPWTGHWHSDAFRFQLPVDASFIDVVILCSFSCAKDAAVTVDDVLLILCEAPP